MNKKLITSDDIFHDICDVLKIPKDERGGIKSMDVHLPNSGAVTYEVEKYVYVVVAGEGCE